MTFGTYTGETDETDGARNCTYWIRDDGREYITDPNGEIVNLARLTAYAEYGEAIHDAHAHHELPSMKIDARKYLDALSPADHSEISHDEVQLVDGVPLVRAGP